MKKYRLQVISIFLSFLFVMMPVYASAAESDFSLSYTEELQSVQSSYCLTPGTYVVSFHYPDGQFDDFISAPFVLTEVPKDKCSNYVFIFNNGVKWYEFGICENEPGIYYYDFYAVEVDGSNSHDFSEVLAEVTFIPVNSSDVPVNGESPEGILTSIGTFFQQCISWLGNIATLVSNNLALTVLVFGMVIAGVVIGYLKRLSNL